MLFLVVSEPRPGSPSSVAAAAWQRYWLWAEVADRARHHPVRAWPVTRGTHSILPEWL
jgi:hypothetical protein